MFRMKGIALPVLAILVLALTLGCTDLSDTILDDGGPDISDGNQASQKIIFWPPESLEAIEGTFFSYSFCQPESAISGATCGGLAGTTIEPTFGTPPYSFSVEFGEGFLPPGLALELNGRLKGTPTLAGTYPVGICAKDSQDEVCNSTTIIVGPKPGVDVVPGTNVDVIPDKNDDVGPDETLGVFDVKISSYTCVLTDVTKGGESYKYVLTYVRAIMSGTAQGPVGARAYLTDLIWVTDKFDCGAWTYESYGICVRKEGQPETTAWSVDTEGDEQGGWLKGTTLSDTVGIYKMGDNYYLDDPQKEDTKSVVCG